MPVGETERIRSGDQCLVPGLDRGRRTRGSVGASLITLNHFSGKPNKRESGGSYGASNVPPAACSPIIQAIGDHTAQRCRVNIYNAPSSLLPPAEYQRPFFIPILFHSHKLPYIRSFRTTREGDKCGDIWKGEKQKKNPSSQEWRLKKLLHSDRT